MESLTATVMSKLKVFVFFTDDTHVTMTLFVSHDLRGVLIKTFQLLCTIPTG